MSNSIQPNHSPRILFFGMQGNFSSPSLHKLLESGIEVCAVVLPASPNTDPDQPALWRKEPPHRTSRMLPVLNFSFHTNIVQLAWERQIPIWEVQHLAHPTTIATLSAYQPDVLCVACFSQRIPRTILAIPRLGSLNVHPSLLPANRGPEPLFWTFYQGDTQTGVTIHMMDEGMDTGDILAQKSIDVPEGISYTQLETQCAALGGKLLVQTVWNIYNGSAVRVPQDEMKISYHPYPTRNDFVIPTAEWTARRVYTFIRGIRSWGEPISLKVGMESFPVEDVISYNLKSKDAHSDKAHSNYYWEGQELWVCCKDGWVEFIVSQGDSLG